jgi:hypothetical protein
MTQIQNSKNQATFLTNDTFTGTASFAKRYCATAVNALVIEY